MFKRCTALIVTMLWLASAIPAVAADPGTVSGAAPPKAKVSANASTNSLTEFRSIVGKVVLSEDACGTNTPDCTVDIVKPSATAKVREAHLFCTTIPDGYLPRDGDVTINTVAVAWDEVLRYEYPGGFVAYNARDDVTATVKPVADLALPGLVSFTIAEGPTLEYDGCALKVIWDDPTQPADNSILIFWGHQESGGDTFVINFAPLTASSMTLPLEFSLGISFGFQPSDPSQFSQVDVNGTRLTTSAGGQDDGDDGNGSLITLGGTGDTPVNPPPMAPPVTPSNPDDELYDLRPFVSTGDTSMTIFTTNPSNDDNIFLANLFLRNVTVVPPPPPGPAHLTLEPKTATNVVGTRHCVTATVTDANGHPLPLVAVDFSVSGANTAAGASVTDANGQAQFCYIGTFVGDDTITATAVGGTNPSDTAAKTWTHGRPATVEVTPRTATNTVGDEHCVTATVRDEFGNLVPNVEVFFTVPTSPATGADPASGHATTDSNGQARFCWTAVLPGEDIVRAVADANGNGRPDAGEPEGQATKTWILPASTEFCDVKVTEGGWIIARNGDRANFGGNAKVLQGGTLQGQEEYQDKGPAVVMNLHSTKILALTCTPDLKHATIWGEATINGTGMPPTGLNPWTFRIDVTDMGSGGSNDSYGIIVNNGYASGQQDLKGGNVTIHKT
jgi:Big-like domain-containing protein